MNVILLTGIDLPTVSPKRAEQNKNSLSDSVHTKLRCLIGQLNWIFQGSRPDLAYEMVALSMKFKTGTVDDLLRGVKLLEMLRVKL